MKAAFHGSPLLYVPCRARRHAWQGAGGGRRPCRGWLAPTDSLWLVFSGSRACVSACLCVCVRARALGRIDGHNAACFQAVFRLFVEAQKRARNTRQPLVGCRGGHPAHCASAGVACIVLGAPQTARSRRARHRPVHVGQATEPARRVAGTQARVAVQHTPSLLDGDRACLSAPTEVLLAAVRRPPPARLATGRGLRCPWCVHPPLRPPPLCRPLRSCRLRGCVQAHGFRCNGMTKLLIHLSVRLSVCLSVRLFVCYASLSALFMPMAPPPPRAGAPAAACKPARTSASARSEVAYGSCTRRPLASRPDEGTRAPAPQPRARQAAGDCACLRMACSTTARRAQACKPADWPAPPGRPPHPGLCSRGSPKLSLDKMAAANTHFGP